MGTLGKHWTLNPDTRAKMSAAQRGNKKALGKRWKWSEAARRRISIARIGHPSPMKGRTLGPAARARMSKARKILYGNDPTKHPRWIADRTLLKTDRQHMYDSQYKNWMRRVKTRDGWKCRIADKNCEGKVVAHHILPWSSFPELRYQLTNGITLCQHHHPVSRMGEVLLSPFFQEVAVDANYFGL